MGGDWGHRFTLLRAELLKLNTIEDIVTASKEYHVILPTKKWNAPFMTTNNFLEITAEGMKDQFESAIMDPYYDMLAAAPTPKPTRFPTPQPVGPAPVVDRGNMYSAGQKCEGDRCLGRCEGDCDTDDHCEEGLMCWERNKWDPNLPPGCIGKAHGNDHDYCYDPDDRITTKN